MAFAHQKLKIAVSFLTADHRSIQDRLLCACACLSSLSASDFPTEAMRDQFEAFWKEVHKETTLDEQGLHIGAIEKMDAAKMQAMAQIIVSLYQAIENVQER